VSERDAPYPELKQTHTMARTGRPWTDRKPPPAAPVWAVIQGFGAYHVLLAALDLGVFDALAGGGPATAPALAERLGVSAPHLGSVLDGLAVLGLLDQVRDVYDVNDTSRRYLVSDGPACMAALVPVAPGPHDNWERLADTVRAGRPATPIDDDPEAFYVPLARGTFATMLRAATRLDLRIGYSRHPSARVLDLGAGGAPWSIAVLTACPQGRAVVNDLPAVLELARSNAAAHGVADRCTFLPGDFHTVPIDPGAFDLAVLGHVCRTEGERGARHLIARAVEALAPGGRLLLADYFADSERKRNPHAVLMGTTMVANTRCGIPLTYGQVSGWLRDAGLEAVRLVEPIGFQQVFVATKPRAAPPPHEEGDR
jgi:precorrin-6B methylase 2